MTPSPLEALALRISALKKTTPLVRWRGEVMAVQPSAILVSGLSLHLRLGGLVEVVLPSGTVLAEVIRFDRGQAAVKPLREGAPVTLGAPVYPAGERVLYPAAGWKGRIINALGDPADGGCNLVHGATAVALQQQAPGAMSRAAIGQPVATGVRVIDLFTPLCLGQRIGIFAGSGVGKSTLLSMLARSSGFDSVIVALVGERGREVREFVETTLGAMARTAITVVATGDESAMMRRMAPLTATAIAEFFRDRGDRVLLIMDSVTRYALACREVALAAGEPPVARGFPPSVFGDLPRLLERAGPGPQGKGSITGLYAVLVDGDDHNDPVADTIRGTLDGHIVLDRAIAESGRYPAVDVLASISRLADRVWNAEQRKTVIELRRLVGRYEESRDLRAVGGYVPGGDVELDRAIAIVPKLYRLLTQGIDGPTSSDVFGEVAECLSG